MRQRLHALQWRHSAIHREAYDLSGRTQEKAAPKGGFGTRTLLALKLVAGTGFEPVTFRL